MSGSYCTNCGQQYSEGQKFCGSCGVELNGKQADDSSKTIDYYVSPKPSIIPTLQNLLKNRKLLAVIGGVIGAIIIALTIIPGNNSPSNVAEEFIVHTQNGDYESAEALWSQDGIDYMLSQLMGDERWIEQNMRNFTHRTDGDLDEFEITEEEKVDNDMTIVYADFTFDNGKRETAELAMVKEEGKWKVFAFNSY
ncbi:Lumazine-binding domain protein [Bacillus sp. THAF10]|uniref:zinc ribbon domain-containing protein n=1 Tax=Bacillus sp. THAF10 TaxID=2587848 RepID=UPI0012A99B0F|nr:zinc ribbon domain-containing protein [Bacillus sp. THAF10]QFT90819.1 Lumazine-binding domain protein [Bacillus sp. THAF10]